MKSRMVLLFGFTAATLTALAGLWQSGGTGIALVDGAHKNEPTRVALVFPDSPAERAGIKTNWLLISVDGTNVVSIPAYQCTKLVCGHVGTSVALELADPAMKRTNRFSVERANIKLPDALLGRPLDPHSLLIAR